MFYLVVPVIYTIPYYNELSYNGTHLYFAIVWQSDEQNKVYIVSNLRIVMPCNPDFLDIFVGWRCTNEFVLIENNTVANFTGNLSESPRQLKLVDQVIKTVFHCHALLSGTSRQA